MLAEGWTDEENAGMPVLRPYTRPRRVPFPVVPTEIALLPFNSLRTSLYPRLSHAPGPSALGRPHLAEQAAAEFYTNMARGSKPQLLPQRMAFQQWKRSLGGDGMNRGPLRHWLNSASSWSHLVNLYDSGVPTRVARAVGPYPTYELAVAARRYGGAALPQPDQDLNQVYVRNAPPDGPTARFHGRQDPPPEAWAQSAEELSARSALKTATKRAAALSQVQRSLSRARSFVQL